MQFDGGYVNQMRFFVIVLLSSVYVIDLIMGNAHQLEE